MTTLVDSSAAATLPYIAKQLGLETNLLRRFYSLTMLPLFTVPVVSAALPFNIYDRTVRSVERDPSGNALRIATEVGNVRYDCQEATVEALIFDRELEEYKHLPDEARMTAYEKAQYAKAKQALLTLLIARESAAATLLFNTTTFTGRTTTIGAGDEFDNTGKNPLDTLTEAIGAVEDRIGIRPDQLNIPSATYRALVRNADVVAEIKSNPAYTNLPKDAIPAQIPASALASILELDRVVVMNSKKSSAKQPKTQTLADIWNTDMCMVCYTGDSGDEDVRLGHTFNYAEGLETGMQSQAETLEENTDQAFKVDAYREEAAKADVIRTADYIDQVVTNADAGQLITNCLQ